MKKVTLAVAAILAIGSYALTGCNKAEQTAQAEVTPGDSSTLNVRYINMDSVLSNYDLAKELMAERQRVALEFQNQVNARESQLNTLGNQIQQKINQGIYLSQQSAQADQDKFNRQMNDYQTWGNKRQQEIAVIIDQQNSRLMDSVRNVVTALSLANHFDVVNEENSSIYINPELDITAAVIEALNARYKSTAPAAEAPKAEAAPAAKK